MAAGGLGSKRKAKDQELMPYIRSGSELNE